MLQSWYTSLLLQIAPIVLSAIAPLITDLVKKLLASVGAMIPAQMMPAVNAILGAVMAGIAGGSPAAGALAAHVVRSGLAHEVPVKK